MADGVDRLQALPPELLDATIEYIPRPTDLKSLCLTSRTVNAHATPKLYFCIEVEKASKCWPLRLGHGLLDPNNRGLPHVRALCVKQADGKTSDEENRLLQWLLQIIPRNNMKELMCSTVDIDERTLTLLLTQQRKLETLRLGALTFDSATLLSAKSFVADACTNLTDIEIPETIQGHQDIAFHNYIISNSPNLKRMAIRTYVSIEGLSGRLQDKTDADGLLLPGLFAHQQEQQSFSPPPLQTLILQNQLLFSTTTTLSTAIDFSKVRELHLYDCNADTFLSALAADFQARGCELQHFYYEAEDCDLNVMANFLRSFKGLESLYLYTETLVGLDLSCADGHISSLHSFAAALSDICQCNESQADRFGNLLRFAQKMKNASMLGVVLTPNSCTSDMMESVDEYSEAIASLLRQNDLDVLRIFNWPTASLELFRFSGVDEEEDQQLVKLNQCAYLCELDAFVSSLFERLGDVMQGRRYPIFCFGSTGNWLCDGDTHERLRPVYYVAAKQTDLYGVAKMVASRVDRPKAFYAEGPNDMFYFRDTTW